MASPQRIILGVEPADLIDSRRPVVPRIRKGQLIYDTSQALSPPCLYLVADGKVRVSRFTSGGRCTVIDVYTAGEFFGESLLVSLPFSSEQAIALESTRLFSWTEQELDPILSRQPRVALALFRAMAERIASLSDRIESLCTENIERRTARALLRFASRMGKRERDGTTRMPPLTHEFLAQYVGTSRELVTLHMNHLRRGGYISYSRQGTTLNRDAFSEWALPE